MNSSAWLSTKLRTALQTLLTCCIVQNASAQSITGTTSLTNYDVLSLPCTTLKPATWSFVAWPAPYGEIQLVNVLACWFASGRDSDSNSESGFGVGLEGMASESWFDLTAHVAYAWPITDKFDIGVSGQVRSFGARNFNVVLEGGIDAQATVMLDTMWTIGMGVGNLLSAQSYPFTQPKTIRAGVAFITSVTLAVDLIASTNAEAGLQLSALMSLHDNVKLRTRILSAPLTASLDVQLHLDEFSITLLFDHHTEIGSSIGIAVELPHNE